MHGYLAPIGGTDDTVRRIVLEEPVGVFRSGHDVLAETPTGEVELGIQDVTVSRRSGEEPPVEFVPRRDAIEVRNYGNANPVTVETAVDATEIAEGEFERITQDATVSLGYNTDLHVTVERAQSGRTLTKEELSDLGLVGSDASSVMTGVAPASYVQSVADNLRKARTESPNECLKYATELHTFVTEHPVPEEAHGHLEDDLGQAVERLDRKVSNSALRGTDLDEEWLAELDRLAHRAERLYARS